MKLYVTIILTFLCWQVQAQYNYLGTYSADGTPDYLEPVNDIISPATLEAINAALPERYPVPDYNPHYISSGYETNIHLTDSAEVYVTFVAEGAGYKNVLGYYTYDVSDGPGIPQDQDITIIFPNVSAKGSGGGLEAGNKVKLGNFSAGTGIGWVLLANGWNGQVTSGLWTLYSDSQFNPETDESLKQHNVLLQDQENQRVILGFEDIRRDYASCDNDFNDAIFYITANPFEAMELANVTPIETANTEVTSGNDGGLESNGTLAAALAQRFFQRSKSTKLLANKRINQKSFKAFNFSKSVLSSDDPAAHIPRAGMTGSESAYVSSPQDLIALTNAEEIFAADYYLSSGRVGAVLASKTSGRIYDHSKTICDRLNGARMQEVRPIKLKGFSLINSVIERAPGQVEYAISFSLRLEDHKIYSLWNIDQYPGGNYMNFQFWGSSMGQVSALAGKVLENLQQSYNLTAANQDVELPTVFVAAGKYHQGQLYLDLVNKSKAREASLNISASVAEFEAPQISAMTISLTGELNQQLVVPMSSMFDAGISLKVDGANQADALYLADGAWGVDYLDTQVKNVDFKVSSESRSATPSQFQVARMPELQADVKGTLNLFRNLLAGNQALDISDYRSLSFRIESEQPVEVILVAEDLTDWSARARYKLEPLPSGGHQIIDLKEFVDGQGNRVALSKVKTIVFSVQGDYQKYTTANLKLEQVAFGMEEEIEPVFEQANRVQNYPNPFTDVTTFNINTTDGAGQLIVSDLYGRTVYTATHELQSGKLRFDGSKLPYGIYQFKIETAGGSFGGKLIKQ